MSGGDEVSALVLDLGSHTCKAGYAGDDAPKAVFPSAFGMVSEDDGSEGSNAKAMREADDLRISSDGGGGDGPDSKRVKLDAAGGAAPGGAAAAAAAAAAAIGSAPAGKRKLFVGSTALGYRRDHMEVLPSVSDGLLSDWEGVAAIWKHAINDRLLVDSREHALLVAEPTFNPPAAREKTVELLFETLAPPAVFLARNAVLTSFSCGKQTSLVVDSGYASTTVAAVHDGYVLQKSVQRSPVAGDALTEYLLRTVGRHKVRPRFAFKRVLAQPDKFEVSDLDFPHTTDSYRLYMQKAIIADMKETVCRVPEAQFDDSSFANVPTVSYELPDGQVFELGVDRFKVPDALFNPNLLASFPPEASASAAAGGSWSNEAFLEASKMPGLPKMVVDSIGKCDVDIRKDLYSSVLLSGGTMTMQQVKERLEKELMEESPQAAKVKVLASGNSVERKFSVWIGGSILASLGSFQQLWFSKSEYEEHGAAYIHRKCP